MKKVHFQTLLIFVFIIFGHQAMAHLLLAVKPDRGEVKAALRKVNQAYGESFIKGDSSLFIDSYTSDACILPTNSPAICGRQGQLAFFKFAYKSGVRNIVFTTLDIYGLTAQYVTEQGIYEMFGANNVSLGKGKYLVLWKKNTRRLENVS
jgi:ketosteroid isomerase-like protein